MPSKINYKRKKLLVPPELKAWFDINKYDKSPETLEKMRKVREAMRAKSGNSDRDHSLFRGKMRGDCHFKELELVEAVKEAGITREDGRPVVSGHGKQTNLLEII